MTSKKWALEFNRIIADFSGGSSGIRDEKLLSSALNRPMSRSSMSLLSLPQKENWNLQK